MENTVFTRLAVAKLLEREFIEARLHTDLKGKGLQQILHLQEKYSESFALPTYVIVDPKTEARIARERGILSEETFVAFLRTLDP